MKKLNEREEDTDWKPSAREAHELSEKLNFFTKKEINGKMQYPFELYLYKEEVVSFDQYGRMQVRNPFLYKKLNAINDLRMWIADKEMETLFQAFLEERVIHEAKIEERKLEIRELLGKFKFA